MSKTLSGGQEVKNVVEKSGSETRCLEVRKFKTLSGSQEVKFNCVGV